MLTLLIGLLGMACVAAGVWLWLHDRGARRSPQHAYRRDELRWMPPEIAGAELVASERQLYATLDGRSVPVRPDQVYRTADRLLVPVDSKTRGRDVTYQADVIEISMQRLALLESNAHGREQVAAHGYVRVKLRGANPRPRYHRVLLWDRRRLEALYRRYMGIIAGDIEPESQTNRGACLKCPLRSRCPDAL